MFLQNYDISVQELVDFTKLPILEILVILSARNTINFECGDYSYSDLNDFINELMYMEPNEAIIKIDFKKMRVTIEGVWRVLHHFLSMTPDSDKKAVHNAILNFVTIRG